MPSEKPLEQPILDAVIHHAYMLHDDEREALLHSFLEMSCRIHREAVEIISPGENVDSLIAREQAQEVSSAISLRGEAMADSPGNEPSEPVYREPMVAKYLKMFSGMFRRPDSGLQEDEELALFSTIEGVADQVNREALEWEIAGELVGDLRFSAAYERDGSGRWSPGEDSGTESGTERKGLLAAERRAKGGMPGWPFDSYIALMDDELLFTRGIIEKNRVTAERYIKAAHAI